MPPFLEGLTLETILGFGSAVLVAATYLADRYGAFAIFSKKAFHVNGEWRGWSVFRPVNLRVNSTHSDEEHFFKISIRMKQRFGRIKFEETIEEILRSDGSRISDVEPRHFVGRGSIVGGVNVAATFDERQGLTCGTMFLTLDTWGKSLSGVGVVRNVDGKPVIIDVVLTRHPAPAPNLPALMLLPKTEQRQLRVE